MDSGPLPLIVLWPPSIGLSAYFTSALVRDDERDPEVLQSHGNARLVHSLQVILKGEFNLVGGSVGLLDRSKV